MSFYTSLTGLNSATAQLAVTANNIANVGTSGFKRSRANFGDIFSTSPLQKSSAQIGQGVSLKQVSQEFSQGNISTSGNSLDLAITGDGFFPLKSPDGLQDIYTRNGSFTLNDQNNVVNSTGQRLMAASVDSSGKADLTNLAALTIPPKTSGQAVETTKIQLGLNLPADSEVITANFDRTNPATYNKSTALTVYDSGGNGYLATVYYVKTQNASPTSPQSKWQTFFYVGDTLVKPALLQAQDKAGSALYMNKYGDVLPKSDPSVIPSSGTLAMYTLDEQSNTQVSSSAEVSTADGSFSQSSLTTAAGTGAVGTSSITLSATVGSNVTPYTISYNLTDADRYPEALASNIESAINEKLISKGEAARVKVTWVPPEGTTPGKFEIANRTGSTVVTADESTADKFSDDLLAKQSTAFTYGPKLEFSINVDEMGTSMPISYGLLQSDKDPKVLAKNLEIFINNQVGKSTNADPRYGVKVSFLADRNAFQFSSGTTGDNSSIVVSAANTDAQNILGLPDPASTEGATELRVDPSLTDPDRGKVSNPAVLVGDVITSNTSGTMSVTSQNKDFFVTVGNISGNVEVPIDKYPSMEKFAAKLQDSINSLIDTTTGRKVSGVSVSWDSTTKRLSFKTGETGNATSLQISGSADWGLSNTEMAYGSTSTWIKLKQFTQNGVPQYVKNGQQTEDATDLSTKTQWWPVYLDRGELSFDLLANRSRP